jgi:hypothetical protein
MNSPKKKKEKKKKENWPPRHPNPHSSLQGGLFAFSEREPFLSCSITGSGRTLHFYLTFQIDRLIHAITANMNPLNSA